MLIQKESLRALLVHILGQRVEQGCDLDKNAIGERIAAADSYDALYTIALELRSPPVRPDWPYREPVAWDEIVVESEHLNPQQLWPQPDLAQAA